VLNKYLDAIGGRASVEKLQSLSMTGSVTDRAGKTAAFTIEERADKYRESRQSQPAAIVRGYDGANGWEQTGANTVDLIGFLLDQSLRLDDLGRPLHLKEKYTNLMASNRPMQINGKDTVTLTGRAGIVSEQFSFDTASGLLLRRVIMTRTVLGTLREQVDYADYRPAGDVKIPFHITSTTWNALDTYKVADAKANATLDDARFAKVK
jgi:zinc protease